MQLINQLNKSIKLLKRAVHDILDESKSSLTTDQWLVLASVNELNQPNQSQIAYSLNKESASLSRIIDILEKQNFVIRKNTKDDRRSFIIKPTVEGSRLYRLIQPKMYQLEKHLSRVNFQSGDELENILNNISTIDN